MKKLVLLLVMVFLGVMSYSQVFVNNQNGSKDEMVDINKLDIEYIQVVATGKLLSNKVTIGIDYGQFRKFTEVDVIVDSDNKKIVFNSNVDVFNYLDKQGWNYLDAYTVSNGNMLVYYYTFKKKE